MPTCQRHIVGTNDDLDELWHTLHCEYVSEMQRTQFEKHVVYCVQWPHPDLEKFDDRDPGASHECQMGIAGRNVEEHRPDGHHRCTQGYQSWKSVDEGLCHDAQEKSHLQVG